MIPEICGDGYKNYKAKFEACKPNEFLAFKTAFLHNQGW
jgi:hypothetical protein